MRKRMIAVILIVLSVGLSVGCERDRGYHESESEEETAGGTSAESEMTQDSELSEEVPNLPSEQNRSYSEALSEEEIEEVRSLAEAFYKDEFPYDLLSLQLADDTHFIYRNYSDYEAGNLIAFLAETTHGGEGIYRSIIYGRKDRDSEWVRMNEGY